MSPDSSDHNGASHLGGTASVECLTTPKQGVRGELAIADVEEREDAQVNEQPKATHSCDHQLFFVFVLGKPVVLLNFLLFSKPLCAFFDDRLPCAVAEAEVDQGGDLPPVFGCKCCKFGVGGFTGY